MSENETHGELIFTGSGMMLFPESMVKRFRHVNGQRWGQAFYDFAKLHKCTQDRAFCDRLYNAPDPIAKMLVRDRTQLGQ